MRFLRLMLLGLTSVLLTVIAPASPANAFAPVDAPSPEAILSQYPDWVLTTLCKSNVSAPQNPTAGKTFRFQVPVGINLNGVPQVREAIRNIEAMTSGAVTFKLVDADPRVGVSVVTGDALTRDGTPGLGHVNSAREPQAGFAPNIRNDGSINSRLYIHLGSAQRDHTREGFRPYSIAEHEIAHALGLIGHFPGFTGIEGISLEMLVTLTALYRVPPGTDMSQFCALP